MIGTVVERITVIEEAQPGQHGKSRWLCRCSCGAETVVR